MNTHTEPIISNLSRTKATKVVKVLTHNNLDAFVQDYPINPRRAEVRVPAHDWPAAIQILAKSQRCY